MTNDERSPKFEVRSPKLKSSSFVIRNSLVIRHSLLVIFQRQFNGKTAAFSDSASHEDLTAVRLDNMFNNAQPNAHTLRFSAQLRTEAVKPFEDFLMLL